MMATIKKTTGLTSSDSNSRHRTRGCKGTNYGQVYSAIDDKINGRSEADPRVALAEQHNCWTDGARQSRIRIRRGCFYPSYSRAPWLGIDPPGTNSTCVWSAGRNTGAPYVV